MIYVIREGKKQAILSGIARKDGKFYDVHQTFNPDTNWWVTDEVRESPDQAAFLDFLKKYGFTHEDTNRAEMYDGYIDEFFGDGADEEEDAYCPSCTAGDYGPGNPWDAPGMSISDFI